MSRRAHDQGQPKGPSQRQLRVGELIRHALADLIARGEIQDDEIDRLIVTIPEVRVSPDLKNATVYVTALVGADPQAAPKALARHKGFIRSQIARRIDLRYAPDLVFRFDDRFDEDARIDALLRSPEVKRDIEAPSSEDGDGGDGGGD
ncbi:30S ribosome-binding factor RbfA [Oharaeibacter diazotrophicus]|uniref:Ribosome-binding factor A n=1 Tax=Oharaeibacter diazotrophicus TaxID=1920512 RepID=A0A4R6R7F4_9HYPH|nr:30S ribosome-binding factor RbfA [Oharaeibacter diazotrophicus]TDP81496.1 ribosome-binding factor A [Oharaeibacter diazotrophicus]BBE73734.1 ribosome-binding factor A [Pleomorphomonas sp. SM30]GLS75524.1 ribosome-binding factor A [Oharaeibacter diazotrophicus]